MLPKRVTHLLYLHGFRSSPHSTKARRVEAEIEQLRQSQQHAPHWWCPQLPPSPAAAIHMLQEGIAEWPLDTTAVVGSSLGGFYATVLAEQFSTDAVVMNPVVEPARVLADQVGKSFDNWHLPHERFVFLAQYIDELKTLTPPALTNLPRYFAIIATGDELLDWREMTARYAGAQIKLIQGSDHALSDFDDHLPDLLRFLRLLS
jgi:uncharacterized protein